MPWDRQLVAEGGVPQRGRCSRRGRISVVALVDASSFSVMHAYGMRDALTTDHHFEQPQLTWLPAQP